ncbi:DUF4270 family protein [Spirosoma fluviale]|uniref:DUF4270 domain-containing protein n=1 Tax=Spirosoma fluviale TaxID=1597977 RepID=A0A286FHF1_9BACT|nr:DUF4270 family protein [Spirosoma fluviale]SOD82516.1 protein of unknown function [Spirosoma fluviale]
MRILWYAGLLWLTGIVLFGCQSGDLNVGQSVINPQQLQVFSLDSMTVKTSTVMRTDSFLTSGSSEPDIAVGYWKDAQTGQQTVQSFAAIDYPANSLVSQTNFRLDSLVLEFGYSFVYGDTTSTFDLNVSLLNRPMPAQFYYNTSSVGYAAKPIAKRSFLPRPLSGTRQLQVRMPDSLAQNLFNKLISGEITNNINLNDFLPGFAMTSTSTANTMLGLSTNSTVSGLRMYYHDTDLNRTAATLLFPITSLHFTKIINDRSGTPLSALKSKSDVVSSTLTNNTTFVSVGAGLQTRVEFPYLNDFFRPENLADLNRALLVINSVRLDRRDNSPPLSSLQLYQTNNQNEFIASIPGGISGGEAASGNYFVDPLAILFTDSYTIDLTYYIGQIIKKKALTQPLLLGVPTPQGGYTIRTLLQRSALGDQFKQNDQLQLKLFVTSGT